MTKISVLMPIYNTDEKHLKEAIQSILDQTFTEFEFLILNDSPDNTKLDEIVKSYKDKRIKYSKNKENLGITASRNKLINMAKGEYLAVMDHDDISLPTRFEKQKDYLDQHPDVGVVGCKAEMPGGRILKHPVEDSEIRVALVRICAILHPASMIRKDVLKKNKISYEPEFSPSEDYALWCRLVPYTKFCNLDEVLFKYRIHESNTSKTQKNKMLATTHVIHAMMKVNHPDLYEEFVMKSKKISRVRLFGALPLLKIVSKGYKTKIYLFEKILIFSYKQSMKYWDYK